MAKSTEINEYITKRYYRWQDYSKFRCSQAGIPDEATDVLNEVVLSLLQKKEEQLNKLLNTPVRMKKELLTQLDCYVLQMILLNVNSPTSPYQSKYKSIPREKRIDFSIIEFECHIEEDTEQLEYEQEHIYEIREEIEAHENSDNDQDRSGFILERMHQVRKAIDELELSELERAVFEFRFFNDGKFKQWSGNENLKRLYDVYSKTVEKVKNKIKWGQIESKFNIINR